MYNARRRQGQRKLQSNILQYHRVQKPTTYDWTAIITTTVKNTRDNVFLHGARYNVNNIMFSEKTFFVPMYIVWFQVLTENHESTCFYCIHGDMRVTVGKSLRRPVVQIMYAAVSPNSTARIRSNPENVETRTKRLVEYIGARTKHTRNSKKTPKTLVAYLLTIYFVFFSHRQT